MFKFWKKSYLIHLKSWTINIKKCDTLWKSIVYLSTTKLKLGVIVLAVYVCFLQGASLIPKKYWLLTQMSYKIKSLDYIGAAIDFF